MVKSCYFPTTGTKKRFGINYKTGLRSKLEFLGLGEMQESKWSSPNKGLDSCSKTR